MAAQAPIVVAPEVLAEGMERAASWLAAEMARPDSMFRVPSRPGYGRGIERYSGHALLRMAGQAVALYRTAKRRWPELDEPASFTEKLLWMKFFGFLPIPSPADKLAVGRFIPPHLADRVRPAEVLWRSRELGFPPEDAVPPGRHFVKSNNGTADAARFAFPLDEGGRGAFAAWLSGRKRAVPLEVFGEWWYGTFPREIFVEQDAGGGEAVEEWKCHVFRGRCLFVNALEGEPGNRTGNTIYDRELRHLPMQFLETPTGRVRQSLPQFELLREAAEAIAAEMSYARVDFYLTAEGRIVLGEITLCPMNGLNHYSDPEFELRIGEQWDHRFLYD